MSYCQSTSYVESRSAITGRLVRVNGDTHRFFVPVTSWRDARKLSGKMVHWAEKKIPSRVKVLLYDFAKMDSHDAFTGAIDALLAELLRCEHVPQYKAEGVNWLIRLWAEGLIGLPMIWPFTTRMRFLPDLHCCGKQSWILELADLGKRVTAKAAGASEVLLKIAGPTQGVLEAGDVTFDTVSGAAVKAHRPRLSALVTPLVAIQRDKYPGLDPKFVDAWGLGHKRRGFDRTYDWVLVEDPSLGTWRQAIAAWLNDRKHGFSQRSSVADRFFAYLIAHPGLPRSPAEFCLRANTVAPSWSEWLASQDIDDARVYGCRNVMSEFFEWFMFHHLTAEDDYGRPVPSPLHYNPISRAPANHHRSETHRDALPLRYIHELIRIITEDDFAWPKTLRADYFPFRNPATNQFERRWSPVRANAMLIKLHLPLRTYQVRMLDSGEADNEKYDKGLWVRNTGGLANRQRQSVRRGFLRRFRDSRTEREFTGLYVNTNKTSDIYRDERDKGYEVPWQHDYVIGIATTMREWQERYNPIAAPTRWETLHDKSVLRVHSMEALKNREPVCFLFRDPCAQHPNEPVRGDRLQIFWASLMDELERRMAARGHTLPDGSPVTLIEKRNGRGYVQPKYDLHSLRVSLITAYATEGGVPIHILSKCIAGHATVLMTMYYNKPGPAYVTEQMYRAMSQIAEQEQQNFFRFLQNEEFRNASPIVLRNDDAALTALESTSPSSWIVGDIGICPVSASKCGEGGQQVTNHGAKPIHGPVEGGAKNCSRCRFFVTGPAFLGGLVSRFNAAGLALSGVAADLRKIETEICAIEDGVDGDGAADRRQLDRLYERRDRLMEETDQIALNWHALYALIERSRAVITAAPASAPTDGLSLVLGGSQTDFEVALSECVEFELLDAVCQAATVFPNQQVPAANLRRGRILDAMLIRNGRKPVFCALSDEEMLAVGNEMVAFLNARCGRGSTVDLVEGRKMLASTGIMKDLDRELSVEPASPAAVTGIHIRRKLYGAEQA